MRIATSEKALKVEISREIRGGRAVRTVHTKAVTASHAETVETAYS